MYYNQITHDTDEIRLNKIVSALTRRRDSEYDSSGQKFYVEETLACTDIKVAVRKVGEISFPLNKACVQELINVSTTAKFGMGEQVVPDKNVRNSQVFDLKSVDVGVIINQDALALLINNIQKALDFPTNILLTLHLCNMSIYGPGSLFSKHLDSEKLQNMVATLVIILPSPHVGGDLVIRRGNEMHIFSSQDIDEENAKCICFYSDCWYKVNNVQCGYRVALTFNVVQETGELPVAGAIPCTNKKLKAAVQDFFNAGTVEDNPKKVIFFLNRTYTEHSLFWNLLKDEDGQYASSFQSVARELDLDIYLILVNIRQKWSSADQYKADPHWLVEADNTVTCWVDVNNVKLPYAEYSITESEICLVRDTHADFKATKEEFFGSTSNKKATVNYWYKRAGIALWRKSDSLMTKFEINYDGAMAEIRTLISVPGNEKNVMEIMNRAVSISQEGRPMRNDFETFVNVALYVKSKEEASDLLFQFNLDVLIPENVHLLAELQQQYDVDWLTELLRNLRRVKACGNYDSMASEAINPFILKFLNSECDRSVMEVLLNGEVKAFKQSVCRNASPELEDLKLPRELFKACVVIESVELQKDLAQFLTSQPKSFPNSKLIELYHELQKTLSLDSLELLRTYLEQSVKQELSSQTRDPDDWSISEVLSCSCEHCDALSDFLRSKILKSKIWPANESIRNHVMSKLTRSEAPVNVTLDRSKRPYRMVLEKSVDLYPMSIIKCTILNAMLEEFQPKSATKKREVLMEYDDKKRQKL